MSKRNSHIFSVFIVFLALLSISCGVSGLPFLATETPTPTATFTPSPTPTPSFTPTPTPIPTNTPLPTGTQNEEQTDGSILFSDYDNKYQLVLPAEWVILPFDQGELQALVEKLSKDNSKFEEVANAFKNLNPDVFRLVALSQEEKYFESGAVPNLNITAMENDVLAAMPISFVTGAMEEAFKQNGIKVVSEGVNPIDNSNGVEIEFLDIEQEVNGIEVAQRVVVFQSNKKLIMITVTSPKNFQEEVFASGNLIGASVTLLK